jgi:hypothetical protein
MNQGSVEQARALAIERWGKLHDFDLDEQTWDRLFEAHPPGEILEAIRKTKFTHDRRIEAAYSSLVYWLESFKKSRLNRGTWPPPDVQPNNN